MFRLRLMGSGTQPHYFKLKKRSNFARFRGIELVDESIAYSDAHSELLLKKIIKKDGK